MRILVLSDLHLEFWPFAPPAVECDAVVLAGDIAPGLGGVEWAAAAFPGRPVVYVAGNHKFFQHSLPELRADLVRRGRELGVHVLDDTAVELGGIRFLGCTLWTDQSVFGGRSPDLRRIERGMPDYRLIRVDAERRLLHLADTRALHQRSLEWLDAEFAAHPHAPAVVVTHHLPSFRSVADRFARHPLTPAFVSHLDDRIERYGARLWIHGHTHHCVDYTIGRTRVLSNARGYPHEDVPGFAAARLVEV